MRQLCQGHGDRLPLVPQGSAQSSPSSPLCGSRSAFDIHHVDRWRSSQQVTQMKEWALLTGNGLVVVVVVVVVLDAG